MNFYKRFIGDYQRDTGHLSMSDHGAYTLMLDIYYGTEKPLPKDRKSLYRLLRATEKTERESVDRVIDEYWTETDDGFENSKANRVLADANARSEKAKQSAERRWKRNANADASDMRTHSERNASHSQTPEGELVVRPLGGASCSPLPQVEQPPITDSGEDEIWKRMLPK